jgi:beta-glucosidase
LIDLFLNRVNTEWSLVFSDLKGTALGYALPQGRIPLAREDFITCRENAFGEDFAWGVATASY